MKKDKVIFRYKCNPVLTTLTVILIPISFFLSVVIIKSVMHKYSASAIFSPRKKRALPDCSKSDAPENISSTENPQNDSEQFTND